MKLPPAEAEGEVINMTPVIDVVFLLLIFFLVATHFGEQARMERELPVVLPEVAQAQPLAGSPEVVVIVTRDGKYKVEQKPYGEGQLLALLRDWRKKNPHQSVLIRADGRSELKYAARVMGLCIKVDPKLKYRLATLQEQ
jgi:biopolymer transport protein ExbD